ncbi:endu-2, partial [Pristionchus pacificus]
LQVKATRPEAMRLALVLLACLVLVRSAPLPAVDANDVTSFLTQLALNDENRAKSGQVVVAFQNMASTKTFDHDNAPNPLFTSVDPNLLGEHTYKSFTDLIAKFTSQDANVADAETDDRKAAALGFIDDISLTTVFMQAWSYLNTAGVSSGDYNEFRDQLYSVWFSVFARDKVAGSSGFKATFVGEYQNDVVVGLTNWITFSQLETVKGVNYHGWFNKQGDVQVEMQFGLELPVGEKQAFRSNLLLNTSPEFEFMAYAVCALTGNSACNLMISGNQVGLHVDTVTVDGNRVISVAYPSIGDISATTTKKPTTPKAPADLELQDLVNNMRAQDDDKPMSSQYLLTWGDKLGKNPKPSGKDLVSNVDESLFDTPVYAALKKVYDNGILVPDVCTTETDYNSGFKRSILQSLLDTWSTTKPFQLMHDFLVGRGKVPADLTQFKQFLTTFWFGTYTRCSDKKTIGSSGFEHVFSGEWKGTTIDGHHNWMKYYINQKAGEIKYYGYYSEQGQLTGTYEYDWAGLNKKTGGMLFGTSPVFDFSLFTACSLTHTGEAGCKFSIDDVPLAVTSYTQDCAGGGLCLSTSYPEDGF